jgi:hypothetical protein
MSRGSVLYPGPLPPPAAQFRYLAQHDFEIQDLPEAPDAHWSIEVAHPVYGRGRLQALRQPVIPPPVLFHHSMMTAEERHRSSQATASVTLTMPGTTGNVLRDRKNALRTLFHCLGEYGVAVIDEPTLKVWGPSALADELTHDAPLDIDGILAVHWVDDPAGLWMHTHGLREIGYVDFDILDPSPDLNTMRAWDIIRAMAFAIAEGAAKPGGPAYRLLHPGGTVALVETGKFLTEGEPGAAKRVAGMVDDFHREGHALLCDAPPQGLLARLRSSGFRPSTFLRNPISDEVLINFSPTAGLLMAERAIGTYGYLRRLWEEFHELHFQTIVKLGYRVDGGSPTSKEFLWFEAHELGDDWIDATLTHEAVRISRLKQGKREQHSIQFLADWMIFTPVGTITPRHTVAARAVRANRERLLEAQDKPR